MKQRFSINFNGFKRSVTPKNKPVILTVLILLIVDALLIYIFHPPFNFHSPAFIFYLVLFFSFIFIISYVLNISSKISPKSYRKVNKYSGIAMAVIALIIALSALFTSSIFNAKEYAARINVKEASFDTISEVDFNKTPIIDRISTEALGDRVMGQMPDLVSQFEVSTDYTQISYKNSVYRVTPLEYGDFFKYLTNRDEGIPAYILVNSTTGEAELVRLSDLGLEGMRYVPSAMFNENLMRKLQLDYPFEIFGSPSFEIDDEGHPWYVCTTYTYKAMGTKRSVSGVVLFDPISGDSIKYDSPLDAPKWVDRIYPESLVIEEVDNYGSLKDGFINSIIGQKNVILTSEGYNYLEKDGDIWIYSGLTGASSDAANLGFILVNLRTHEALNISSPGANEISAMASAEGNVKNYGYTATFPLLVNVGGNPVYLMSLKDDAGLIKMYAMVDATDYQKVATVSIDEGLEALKDNFISENINDFNNSSLKEATVTIKNITFLNSGGITKAFIVSSDDEHYKVELNEENEDVLAFLNPGDIVDISYSPSDVNIIKEIKRHD